LRATRLGGAPRLNRKRRDPSPEKEVFAVKKIGILLAGCGRGDGSEVHESTITLLWVVKNGCEPLFFSLDEPQKEVFDHAHNKTTGETRNCMVESARISRGNIRNIKKVSAKDFGALIVPGGSGAGRNLMDADGAKAKPEVLRIIRETYEARKPIGLICIAPTVGAAAFHAMGKKVTLTIGTDAATARKIESLGQTHENCSVDEIIVDRENRVVSTPAYMLAKNIAEVEAGVSKLVAAVAEMMG
jgi:enhancing lycopene biosynthesis protein 2